MRERDFFCCYIKDQVSPDDIQFQTQTSDIQAKQADVLDVLYRCVNSLIVLYTHQSLIKNSIVEENLTPWISDCLSSPLFLQLSLQFLRQNITNDKTNIRSIFYLFTCLDYSIVSTMTASFLPSISHIFHIWCEIPKKSDEEMSLLIIRLIHFLNQFALENHQAIIEENISSFLLPHFDLLCQTSSLIDDLTSLIITLSSTTTGKQHLRQLGFVQHILHEVKRHVQLWHPLGLLITQQDFSQQPSFLKRLIHLLILRTTTILQSLTSATNDTSFDSISPSSKNQLAINAIEWFVLLRTHFLAFSVIINELINSTRKIHLINIFVDTILSLDQDEDIHPKLIEEMIELLWTFTLTNNTNIHETLQKHGQLCQWLKSSITESIPNILLASQAILSILDLNTKLSSKTSFSSFFLIYLNEFFFQLERLLLVVLHSHQTFSFVFSMPMNLIMKLCITLRDRLQIEEQYSVELIVTPTCQSIDSFIHLINHTSLCLFCSSTRMKTDNLSHFIYYYLALQSYKIPLLNILLEDDLDYDGNWLGNIPIIEISSVFKELRRYFHPSQNNPEPKQKLSPTFSALLVIR